MAPFAVLAFENGRFLFAVFDFGAGLFLKLVGISKWYFSLLSSIVFAARDIQVAKFAFGSGHLHVCVGDIDFARVPTLHRRQG